MNPGDRNNHNDPMATVVQALHDAATGTDLRVLPCPELQGATLVGENSEGYVYPSAGGGWQIDLWQPDGINPYQIHRAPTLAAVVNTAIDALRHTGACKPHPHS